MNKLFLMSIMITSLNAWASNGPCQLNQSRFNQSCELSNTTGTNPCQNIANNFSCLNCDLSNIKASQLSSAIQQAITNYQTIHGQGSIVTINLTGANMSGAYLPSVDLSKLNLTSVNLAGSCLQNVNLAGVQAPGVTFTGADLSGANFTNANLTGAVIGGTYNNTNNSPTNLNKTNFTGATLTNIAQGQVMESGSAATNITQNLALSSTANWQTANFSKANLSGVDLSNIASGNATFLEATNLTKANLSGTIFTNITPSAFLNFSDLNMQNTQFNGGSLVGVPMSNSDFTGATFNNVIFMPETNGVLPSPDSKLSINIENVNFTNVTFNNVQGLISLLASYNGSAPSSFNGAKMGTLNFNAGPNVTLDLTRCNFDGATFGNWVATGAITSTIGGSSTNGTLFPIKFPFMSNVTFNNVQFENLSADLSSTSSTFNNCNFINGIALMELVFNKNYAGTATSPFTINHGSNNLYANCSFKGLTFNNGSNPKNTSVVGMQGAQFVGSVEIAGCYFNFTDFTGAKSSNSSGSEQADWKNFNVSNSSFISYLAATSPAFAKESFFSVMTGNAHIADTTQIYDVNPAKPSDIYHFSISSSA